MNRIYYNNDPWGWEQPCLTWDSHAVVDPTVTQYMLYMIPLSVDQMTVGDPKQVVLPQGLLLTPQNWYQYQYHLPIAQNGREYIMYIISAILMGNTDINLFNIRLPTIYKQYIYI